MKCPAVTRNIVIVLILLLSMHHFSVASDSRDGPSTYEGQAITLAQGEQRLLKFGDIKRYSVGGNAARVTPLPKDIIKLDETAKHSLLIKGMAPGSSDIWVWKLDGSAEHRSIRVEKTSGVKIDLTLERALSHISEAEILLLDGRVVLRGQIRSASELARIAALSRNFSKIIHDETEPSLALLGRSQTQLETWLKTSGYAANLRVERHGSALWLRGPLPRQSERQSIERQARNAFAKVEFDLDYLPDNAPTVYFRVFLLEVKRSRFHSLGLSWPPVQQNAFQVASWGITEALQLEIALQALEGDGGAKVLSRPELAVRAPGEAELFAGGELPIRTQNQYHSEVTWKTYGLTLRLKVTHIAGDRVRLDVQTEVSHLDVNVANDKIPGLQANRMKTQVDAKLGTPLLLSGLLQDDMRRQAQGLPLLRQIPILGVLFGSEDYLNEKSELVAILLPMTSPPEAPMHKVEKKAAPAALAPESQPRSEPEIEKARAPSAKRQYRLSRRLRPAAAPYPWEQFR